MATSVTAILRISDKNQSSLTATAETEGEKGASSGTAMICAAEDWLDMASRIWVIITSAAAEDSAGSGFKSFELSMTNLRYD